jgi:toxin-antitoxin system PIN domain toxin
MTLSVFPDINVWLALAYSRHIHHFEATRWYGSLAEDVELVFCRHTQIGLLRLLTTAAAMSTDVKTQRQSWRIYDTFLESGDTRFMDEPRAIELRFRDLSKLSSASPKDWADSYLAAFAIEARLRLVTFDKALHQHSAGSILLKN